jgi:hypothetical protein
MEKTHDTVCCIPVNSGCYKSHIEDGSDCTLKVTIGKDVIDGNKLSCVYNERVSLNKSKRENTT